MRKVDGILAGGNGICGGVRYLEGYLECRHGLVSYNRFRLDHDLFGSGRPKNINVIVTKKLERDAGGKPHTLSSSRSKQSHRFQTGLSVRGTAIDLKRGAMEAEKLRKWLTAIKPADSLGFSGPETVFPLRNH
ncbi:hypothetical protein CN216_31680 [Sinorhizobium meliloti]|nr:hypothetical protein CN216_31680 [Sinorhizobium meliloti]